MDMSKIRVDCLIDGAALAEAPAVEQRCATAVAEHSGIVCVFQVVQEV